MESGLVILRRMLSVVQDSKLSAIARTSRSLFNIVEAKFLLIHRDRHRCMVTGVSLTALVPDASASIRGDDGDNKAFR